VIPEETIQAVRDAVDIVEVISRHVALKASGSTHKGLCPFHEEKTPSFHVFPQSGRYKCFGCGEGGTVFTFLMKRERLSFVEAVRDLARGAGIALPESDRPAEDDGRRTRALEALRFAAGFYATVLARETGRAAHAYLRGRGISDATIAGFGIGFAPEGWEAFRGYALSKGFTDDQLFDAGLVRRKEDGRPFDMFRGRVMFPIHDVRGRVIGFGARAMGDEPPKYINSPDGPLFRKGRELYAAHLARPAALRAGRVVVVEGYTDVILCHQAGMREVVAALGTALTPDNARALKRFGVPVTLLYDGDEAGLRAAERASDLMLAESAEASVALLEGTKDPADLILERGIEPLREVLARSQDLFGYRIARVVGRHGTGTLDGRAAAVGELIPVVAAIREPIRRDLAFKLLSERLGVPESTLRDSVSREKPRRDSAGEAPRPEAARSLPASPGWRAAERDFLAAAMFDPTIWDEVAAIHPPDSFRDETLRPIAAALHRLLGGGAAPGPDLLLSALSDSDAAAAALESLEPTLEAVSRARRHLDFLREKRLVESALPASSPLDAVVAARKRPPESETHPL